MEWGLLGGLGQGLSQAASTVSRGMAEDRASARAQELEAKRAASVERRWKASEARANRQEQAQAARLARQDTRQRERDAVSDNQFDQRMSAQEAQSIDRNLSGVMEQANKAAEEIENRYAKLAVDSLGQPLPKAQLDALLVEKKREIKAVRTQYASIVDNYVKSYGDKLKGTGFAYLLDVPEIQEAPEKKAPPTSQQGKGSIDDFARKMLGEGSAQNKGLAGYADLEDKIISETQWDDGKADPTFLNAFRNELAGTDKSKQVPISTDRSPYDSLAVHAGHAAGALPGTIKNAVEPAYDWFKTKPSNRNQ